MHGSASHWTSIATQLFAAQSHALQSFSGGPQMSSIMLRIPLDLGIRSGVI